MLVLAALLLIPAIALSVARSVPALDPILESVLFHLYVVSAIAACAMLVALATASYAVRDGRAAPVLIAIGCVAVGFMMLGHGLTTPGIFGRPMNLWVARLPVLALATFAGCLAVAARPDGAISRLVGRSPRVALAFPTVSIALASTAVAVDPTLLWGAAPVPGEERSASCCWSRAPSHCCSSARCTGDAGASAGTGSSSPWSSRAGSRCRPCCRSHTVSSGDCRGGTTTSTCLAGFAAAAWAVVAGYRGSRTLIGAVGGITVRDPLEQVAHGQPDALHALIGAVEAKDPYTHGHSARVAELSTRIGLLLALEPEAVRGLHQGAFLHDVGKISIPNRILNKPSDLDPLEWEEIRRHPEVGWDLVNRANSLRGALSAIRHHHERWDGSGYPDRLGGLDIPLAGRIVAVADVWDALTSDRAYRPAWDPDRAVSHIAAASGTLFDPACVEAFLDVVAETGLAPERTAADLEELIAGCHPAEYPPTAATAEPARER